MTMQQAVSNRILQLCRERDITVSRLAELASLPPSSVRSILYGKSGNPRLTTLGMICAGLDMPLCEFFASDDFKDLEP